MDTMVPEKRWTDNCLSDLDKKVDVGFAQVGKDFARVNERFASVDKRFEKIDERFASVDKRFDQVDERFSLVDKRFDKVDERFEKVEGKINSSVKALDSKFDAKFDGLNKTLLGAAVSVIVTLIACCAALVGAGPF